MANVLNAATRAPARWAPIAAATHSHRLVHNSPTVPPHCTPSACSPPRDCADHLVELGVGHRPIAVDDRGRGPVAPGLLGDELGEVAAEGALGAHVSLKYRSVIRPWR